MYRSISASSSDTRTMGGSLARVQLRERECRVLLNLQRLGRDRVAVRVRCGMAEPDGDRLDEFVRSGVLQGLGVMVHIVPGEVEAGREEQFEESMAADDAEREMLSFCRQRGAVVGPVDDEVPGVHPFQHRGNGPGRDMETFREGSG